MDDYLVKNARLKSARDALTSMWANSDESIGRAIDGIEEHLTRTGKPPTSPGIPYNLKKRLTKFERLFAENSPDKSYVERASELANKIRSISKLRNDLTHGRAQVSFYEPTVEITPLKDQRFREDLKYTMTLDELDSAIARALAGVGGEVTGLLGPFHPTAWRHYWPPPIGSKQP